MNALRAVPARRVVRAVADAAVRWSDADFPPRVRLLDRIVERTGYTKPVVEYALDQLFGSLTVDSLEATIAGELGSLDVLDEFALRPGRPRARALPAGVVCVISSRTTIGVAIVPAIFALCAKCEVLVKDREDGLVRAFFSTLGQELNEFREVTRAQGWEGEGDAVDLGRFDVVVAFGSDATLGRIAAAMQGGARFIGYGSRASIGYVAREELRDLVQATAIAAGAARDLVLYETEGCLSLHALFVERGGLIDPTHFTALVAHEVERASIEFPPGKRDARASARITNARNLAAFRSAAGSGSVFSDARGSYLAVLDPPASEPPAFLPRALAIHAVDNPSDAIGYLVRHDVPVEAVALAGKREDLRTFATEIGAHRIARFGDLQRPPLGGNHGGRARIADFITWITDER
ncbi:MAG TPA: acyl-CoA reductase [Candidatus Baltobacteraceae bacterium]|nr:acyl-CoA reductase [Candidatus Baltobacteraceae bacterium]